jgi:hypothetical protein
MSDWTLGQVVLVLTILFSVQAFAIVPWTRRRLLAVADTGKPKWAAAVLMFETTQLMTLAALLSAAITWLVFWVITSRSGASSISVSHAIERIQALHDVVNDTKFALWVWAFALASIALCYWIVRRRRAQFSGARSRIIQDKFRALAEEFKRGELAPIDPSPEMIPFIQRLQAIDPQITSFDEQLSAAQNDTDRDNLNAVLARLRQERGAVLDRLVTIDLLRRIEIPPYDPDLIAPPPPRSFGQKLARIFVSRGMFRQLGLGQRALLLLSILLTLPTLLTLTGDTLAAELETRITSLDQLRIELGARESQARFDKASNTAAQEIDSTDNVDDRTYTHIAYAHAHAFEGGLVRNAEKLFPVSDASRSPRTRNAQEALRQQDARRRILKAFAGRQPSATAPGRTAPPPPSGRELEVHGLAARTVVEDVPSRSLSTAANRRLG